MKLRSATKSGTILSIKDFLGSFSKGLAQGHRCTYISSEGMRELDVMTTRARDAADHADFMQNFLNTDDWKGTFRKLGDDVWSVSEETAYNYLKLIDVRTVDIQLRREMNLQVAAMCLEGNPRAALAALGDILKAAVHVSLTAAELEAALETKYGISRKRDLLQQRWRGEATEKTLEAIQDLKLLESFSLATPIYGFDFAGWRTVAQSGQAKRPVYGSMIGTLHDLTDALNDEPPAACKSKCDAALHELENLMLDAKKRATEASSKSSGAQSAVERFRQQEISRRGHHVWTYHEGQDPDLDRAVDASQESVAFRNAKARVAWVIQERELLDGTLRTIKDIKEVINRR